MSHGLNYMRLLIVICESSVENRVFELLQRSGAEGFTRLTGATGLGPNHGRREGSPVWPGLNSVVFSLVPENLVAEIARALDGLRAEREGRLALKVFSTPAEQLL